MKNATVKTEKQIAAAAKAAETRAAKKAAAEAAANEAKKNIIAIALAQRVEAIKQLDPVARASQLKQLGPVVEYFKNDNLAQAARERLHATDWSMVCSVIATGDKTRKTHYVQVKTLVKLCALVRAIAQGLTSALDNNSRIALKGMLDYSNHLNVKEMIAVQSRKVLRDDIRVDMREQIAARASYSVGTASSQSGQVRDLLRLLGLATVQKGARNDDATLNEYGLDVLGKLFGIDA